MQNHTDAELLEALAFEIELNYRRHVAEADIWQPQDFIAWDEGRNFAFLGGEDWSPNQSHLDEVEKVALTVSVLVADNGPSYHREIARNMYIGQWWRWVNRWTAEEHRHAIVLRDFLMVTRAVDPVELERRRMRFMTEGFDRPPLHLLELLVNCAFDETAAALRHRSLAAYTKNPVIAAICNRIAVDDEMQRQVYVNLVDAGLKVAHEQTVAAIADRVRNFATPELALLGRDTVDELAEAGIYDPRREAELVFAPLLRQWEIADRPEFADVLGGVVS
ncbi:acyl-ACP desaturase [Aldersonia sp. NBC_00410]|uniref:acyl-ACP desaturase n=1 Tax=Aldersonia sp. NBC_00410 TaxID=2975954 RepID=UPI002258BB38|nr:acyl-ACP desaturase [Aldersonia sp. NBC_00410]MCX5043866.1 acyl-ACP desaturase [Aldersonia sp. NBC_00410]